MAKTCEQALSNVTMPHEIFLTPSLISLARRQKKTTLQGEELLITKLFGYCITLKKKVVPTYDTSNTLISYGATDIRGQEEKGMLLSTHRSL